MARKLKKKRDRDRKVARRRGDLMPVVIPQEAIVADRREYLVRVLQSRLIETKVFATNADVAQELANNGLGCLTNDTLIVSETRSVNEIG